MTPGWLKPAVDYIPRWIEFQLALHQQPGCVIALAHNDKMVLEEAFGRGLTPRHRFRVASHSKTFAATAVMRLVEQRRLRLDDPAGKYVDGLHPALARATIADFLSHGSGVVRDGPDSGQFVDRRGFLTQAELRNDLEKPAVLPRGRRFKYSNHGYAVIGLAVEAITGERYVDWLQREVIDAAGLRETLADGPVPRGVPLATGHSARL
ncbi:MAG TPA: serine hydrolase domain-containing protein, partial [Burkholderiales bacterium]|nr:serine hydrolase domain-containing protein [Burkholderiales bacterium]